MMNYSSMILQLILLPLYLNALLSASSTVVFGFGQHHQQQQQQQGRRRTAIPSVDFSLGLGDSSRSVSSSSSSSSLSAALSPSTNPFGVCYWRGKRRNTLLILFGAKGGGKGDKGSKKNKSKSSSSTAAASSTSPPKPAPVPQRVSTQINIPIRKQIQYGKINKQYREFLNHGSSFRASNSGSSSSISRGPSSQPITRTSYRKKLDEETIQEKALERQRKGQNPDWAVILNQTKADPLVLVDGYNIIYQWGRLKKHMVREKYIYNT